MNRKIKKIILIVLILVITCTAAFFYAHVKQSSDITVISKEKFIKNGESISFEFRCKGNKLYGIFTDMVPDNSDEGTLYYELKNSSGEIVVNDSISFGTINTDGNTGFGFNKINTIIVSRRKPIYSYLTTPFSLKRTPLSSLHSALNVMV